MTNEEREKIDSLRGSGLGYMKIANTLNLSVATVKSYLRRKGTVVAAPIESTNTCLYCGKELEETRSPRGRKFCNDDCRTKYWNEHRHLMKSKCMEKIICPHCKKEFNVPKSAKRKYCSLSCYASERFKNGK